MPPWGLYQLIDANKQTVVSEMLLNIQLERFCISFTRFNHRQLVHTLLTTVKTCDYIALKENEMLSQIKLTLITISLTTSPEGIKLVLICLWKCKSHKLCTGFIICVLNDVKKSPIVLLSLICCPQNVITLWRHLKIYHNVDNLCLFVAL